MATQKNELFTLQIIISSFIFGIVVLYALVSMQQPKHSTNDFQIVLQYLFLLPVIGWAVKSIMIGKLRKNHRINVGTIFMPHLVLAALCEMSAIIALALAMNSGMNTLNELVVLFSILVLVINFPRKSML